MNSNAQTNDAIVKRLDKLIELTEKNNNKFSMTLQSSWVSINENGKNTARFTDELNSPIILDSMNYEVAVLSLETFYSFPNITLGINSDFGYKTTPAGDTNIINIPTGSYRVEDIATEIKNQVGDAEYQNMALTHNNATLKAVFKLAPTYRIDFTIPNSIRNILGFDSKVIGGIPNNKYYPGDNITSILDVNTILVNCDLTYGSYTNGQILPVIYTFFPNVAPGYKIVRNIENPIYFPVNKTQINNITTWLTDEKGRLINFRGEQISVRYHIRNK